MSDADYPHKRATSIASMVLSDGTIVEMVHRPELNTTSLMCWSDGAWDERDAIGDADEPRYVPYSPNNNLIAHQVVLFPSSAAEFDSPAALLRSVREFIHAYADLSEGFEEIASYYVLLSWIYDAFTEVPYLRLKGDYGSGKSRALQTIGSVCYKPMFVSGASTVSPMFRIIDSFRGTLVLDESDFRFSDERAELTKILNNGNATGFPVLRSESTPTKEFNPRAFAVFGPKIIATRRDFEDRALESRCITEVMSGLPPRADIPLSLPDSFEAEARALRNQLLLFRFRHLHSAGRPVELREIDVEARVAQIFGPLLSLAEDDDARDRLLAVARTQTRSLRAERSATIEADLLSILAPMRRQNEPLLVGEIARRFDEAFRADYDHPISARWVGSQLRRRLSVVAVKVHGAFLIPESNHSKLDRLFERYRIEVESDGQLETGNTSLTIEDVAPGIA